MPLSLALLSLTLSADPVSGLKVPDGFTVTQFAGPELANDIYRLHIDAKGRVVVAGRGYVRQLIDTDGDGKADKAVELIPAPADGPMGLLWEGETLFVTSDGGVKKYTGVTGKEPTKEKPTTVIKLKTGGEHDAHAVARGPDGKLYVLCGNMAGVDARTATTHLTPIVDPVAGCLLRMNDDGTRVEIVADGFRNPYDFDFDLNGTPFTYDSDNERCVGLPWYEPTRFYRILSGGHYGWLSPQHAQTWRTPPYNPYVVAPVVTAGRGSPTGVACYRHTRFPKEYQGGFFFADWTFGTIWFTQPGDTKPKATPFLTVSGENGFAPTGLAVDPTSGDLFVSIGGRGTRGAVYRISYTKNVKGEPIPFDAKPLPRWTPPGIVELKPESLARAKTDKEKLAVVCGWFNLLGGAGDPTSARTVWEGYSFRERPDRDVLAPLVKAAINSFPTADDNLNRELTRFVAAAVPEDPAFASTLVKHLGKQTDLVERIHYLVVLSNVRGERTAKDTQVVAELLVTLDGMYAKSGVARDTNWPLRLAEAASRLANQDKSLSQAVAVHPMFGAAEHVWLARAIAGKGAGKAVGAAFAKHAAEGKFAWSAGHAEFVAELPEKEARPLLLKIVEVGFFDAALVHLAKWPKEEDRPLYIRGLASSSSYIIGTSTDALATLPKTGQDEIAPLVRAFRRVRDEKAPRVIQNNVLELLKKRTGESFDDPVKWEAWLAEKHPDLATKSGGVGYDATAWKKRLAKIGFESGDAEKGKAVFAKAQCAACHNGTTAVGPSLVGVAKRFSRDDLLTAVLDPNRDVADRYRTVKFGTAEQVYEGIVIYEATDGVMLQTSADTTVRIPGKAVESRKPGANSLMPTGLLDALTDAEVADLLAYLKKLE